MKRTATDHRLPRRGGICTCALGLAFVWLRGTHARARRPDHRPRVWATANRLVTRREADQRFPAPRRRRGHSAWRRCRGPRSGTRSRHLIAGGSPEPRGLRAEFEPLRHHRHLPTTSSARRTTSVVARARPALIDILNHTGKSISGNGTHSSAQAGTTCATPSK